MKNDLCKFYCYWDTRKSDLVKTNNINKIKLIIFDMDGVLTDIDSSWKHIHDYFDSSNEESVDDYLKGKIDDLEFIRRDIALWKENGKLVKKKIIEDILSDVPIMKGAHECVSALRLNNIKTVIVSAGLDILSNRVAKQLGIDYDYSNGLKTDVDGYLTGEGTLQVQLMYKDKIVKHISEKMKVPLENIAGVGNSCFDIPMLETCGLGIAFNPSDECIKEAADIVVLEKDLSKIIPFIKRYI